MTGFVEMMEQWYDTLEGLKLAQLEGRDYETQWDGEPEELPEGVPSSFAVPLAKIPEVLAAMQKRLGFWEDIIQGLDDMAAGRTRPVRPRAEELDEERGT